MIVSRPVVMVSSTIISMGAYRDAVRDCIDRQSMSAHMMENLPANSDDAIAVSMRMVDEADIYVGVFAYRYGHVPDGYDVSITEMEYERAVERGIPILIFIISKAALIPYDDIEMGEAQVKLEDLKARMRNRHHVREYTSKNTLRTEVINALSYHRQTNLTSFHRLSDIPVPPAVYVAHPYTLMPTKELVGRRAELNLMTEWVSDTGKEIFSASILCFVAMGGMGKSALTWKWFEDLAQRDMKPLAGRMWWSFYESDATFENFVIRALAYVGRMAPEQVMLVPPPEREQRLLEALDANPYLIALDGVERIMLAYAKLDPSRMDESDLDAQTRNHLVDSGERVEAIVNPFQHRHQLRKMIDQRASAFLLRLSKIRKSRILISTRLFPADLQNFGGQEVAGVKAIFLKSLSNGDALALCRVLGLKGTADRLHDVVQSFGNFPLLIRALGGEVANYRKAPGDLDAWLTNHPGFSPWSLPLAQKRTHVLAYALRGMGSNSRKLLLIITAFRMPVTYDTLAALQVGVGRPLLEESALDSALSELEDRGLVGWDRAANRYDVHPVVRGVVWHNLGRAGRQLIYESLRAHFEALPAIDPERVSSIDDLAYIIEFYHILVALEEYDAAYGIFEVHLRPLAVLRLGHANLGWIWLEALFPDGVENLPLVSGLDRPALLMCDLAFCLSESTQQSRGCRIWEKVAWLILESETMKDMRIEIPGLFYNISEVRLVLGDLYQALLAAEQSAKAGRSKEYLAMMATSAVFLIRGALADAERVAMDAASEFERLSASAPEEDVAPYGLLARIKLEKGEIAEAERFVNRSADIARLSRRERAVINSRFLRGLVLLASKRHDAALLELRAALSQARLVNRIENEMEALLAIAKLYLETGNIDKAEEVLAEALPLVEQGPFPLHYADALVTSARCKLAGGDRLSAGDAAQAAYCTAWLDGPPYTYAKCLNEARQILTELGRPVPSDLPLFDPIRQEVLFPMDYRR